MNRQFVEKVFSTERMIKYFDKYPDDVEKAIKHYQVNIALSEAFYPVLSVFEIALRNSINRELVSMFGTQEWYLQIQTTAGLKNLNKEISTALRQISKRNENITGPKIVAELTLGFWIRLFNVEYELILWKHLRRAFPYIPKNEKKRNNISAPLNKIRNFRNRVYHNEPISWSLNGLEDMHEELTMVLGWLNKELPEFIKVNDRFVQVLTKAKVELQ